MEFCEFMMENKMQRILKKTYWINEQLNIPVCTQNSQKLNVRAGNIAPFFNDGKYLTVSPKSNYSKKSANSYCEDIWFQRDRCSRHNAAEVTWFLRTTFPDHLIATNGPSSGLPDHHIYLQMWGYLPIDMSLRELQILMN